MKIYIAYHFSGQDQNELKNFLSRVSEALTDAGHETFIFFRDEQNWGEKTMPPAEVLAGALKHLKDCNGILALQNGVEKSEGLLLEVGYAKALGKQVVVAVKQDVSATFLRCIADKVIEYKSDEELINELNKFIT